MIVILFLALVIVLAILIAILNKENNRLIKQVIELQDENMVLRKGILKEVEKEIDILEAEIIG